MRPTLRQLEYLVAIAEKGTFHAAARACGVSQPGLSLQIQQLEHTLGVTLFERSRRKVLLTPAGEALARRGREVLVGVDDLAAAARSFTRPLAGDLRLGVIPTLAPYWLPAVLPRVRRRFPDLRLLVHEEQTSLLLERLAAGRLDLLALALEARLGEVETRPLFADPFLLAVPRSHPLAAKKSVRETDLAGESLLLLDEGHCLRDQALSLCRRIGTAEVGDFRASSLSTLAQMVAGGIGATLLPAISMRALGLGREVVAIPFRRPAPARTIGLAWRRGSPRTAEFGMLAEALGTTG